MIDENSGEPMNVDELTVAQIKQIQRMLLPPPSSEDPLLRVGDHLIIRTVTHYYTGRLVAITEKELMLLDAAWIADTGRWHNALRDGTLNEVEPFIDPVIISRASIVDATKWRHELPMNQK